MTWEQMLKIDYDASKSSQGLHVTKMYMFLKRYFADTHTKRFLEFYIPYSELDDYTKGRLKNVLEILLTGHGRTWGDTRTFPGITIKELTDDNIDLEFDDSKHIEERDKFIEESEEYKDRDRRTRNYYWWMEPAPYDDKIQSAWRSMSNLIKRSSWHNYGRRNLYR
tara:strand:- start:717 stop:1214 length:498 start_codon:yes stop_codon:yes gene_type:complete